MESLNVSLEEVRLISGFSTPVWEFSDLIKEEGNKCVSCASSHPFISCRDINTNSYIKPMKAKSTPLSISTPIKISHFEPVETLNKRVLK